MRYLPLCLLLIGCAPGVIYCSPRFADGTRVCKSDVNTVSRICTDKAGTWDNGKPRPRWAATNGCPLDAKMVLVVDSCQGAEAFAHERAHLEGVKEPEKSGYDWRDWKSITPMDSEPWTPR